MEDNPAKTFYEKIGATRIGATDGEYGGKLLKEAIYLWQHLDEFKL